MVLGFVAVKYVFKQLGGDALGIIYFTATMIAILGGALNKGVFSTSVREVSAHLDKDPVYIQDLIRTGAFLCWSVYIMFSLAVYLGAPVLINKWIHLSTMDPATATYILRVLGISSLAAFPVSFYSSLLQGLQRMEFNNIIDVAATGMQQFGIIVILSGGGDIFKVAHWIALCYGLRTIGYVTVCSRFFPLQSFVPRYVKGVVKRNSRFASNMVSISVLAMAHKQSDKVIISKLLPVGLLGYYGFVYGAISKGSLLATAVAQAAFPSLCSLFEGNDEGKLLSQYSRLQGLICFTTIPIFALFAFAASPLLANLFNMEVARTLHVPVILLSLGFYLNGTLAVPYRLVLASGKPGISVRSNLYALFAVLPATLMLVSLLGLSGAALGWVLYFLFAYAYAVPKICRECLDKPLWSFFGPLLRIMLLALSTYGVAYGILVLAQKATIFALVLSYCAASALFLSAGYLLSTKELRETMLGNLQFLANRIWLKSTATPANE